VSGATTDVVRISRKVAREAPECTLATARLCVLDFFGLAIAGSREPVARILGQAARLGASPVATAIGHGHHFSLQQATFLNGVAGHALDYDDVALAMHVHPTTVILPPLLALAEARGFSYDEVLRAFVAGYEAAGMVGAWLGSGPYDRGFHMTGTVGCIGAAAGAAYLLDLDEQACARALGLAATQAAGLKAQFGTMAKLLHAGRAAETGLLAALWAGAGLTGRENVLEAQQGSRPPSRRYPRSRSAGRAISSMPMPSSCMPPALACMGRLRQSLRCARKGCVLRMSARCTSKWARGPTACATSPIPQRYGGQVQPALCGGSGLARA
jgi:2-methylcitrate dehydratase PrpD